MRHRTTLGDERTDFLIHQHFDSTDMRKRMVGNDDHSTAGGGRFHL